MSGVSDRINIHSEALGSLGADHLHNSCKSQMQRQGVVLDCKGNTGIICLVIIYQPCSQIIKKHLDLDYIPHSFKKNVGETVAGKGCVK